VDDLDYHRQIQEAKDFPVRVFPAFRPDKAHAIEDPEAYGLWLTRLEEAVGTELPSYDSFLDALKSRHDYFNERGCRLSDHGIEYPADEKSTPSELEAIYRRVRSGVKPEPLAVRKFRSAVLRELGRMDAAAGWTMQLHMGAIRNVNTRMFRVLGRDTGYDSIGDFSIASGLAQFLDGLAAEDKLPRMILYSLNPGDNDVIASIVGSFQDGTFPGKIQFGSGWWFNDQKDGMIKQMTALSNHGLLSRFVGMLTDSRSFLSYPRHEYFRRILCNLIGGWVTSGEAPNDEKLLGNMVEDICYRNAQRYFALEA
jgi:glucuronate isomerase